MCGITGFWDFTSALPREEAARLTHAMADALSERGPDASGVWVDETLSLAFGHRRLSIVDLSPTGAQPMTSASGQYVICYNGELYNTADIRYELESRGKSFRGRSDTEVLLEACDTFGVEDTLKKCVGMFAFALWDKTRHILTLARDRMGVKPLYYGFCGTTLFFASQPKSLFRHPHWQGKINPAALAAFFKYNYVPAPMSIFRDIKKLEAGHIFTIDASRRMKKTRYWDVAACFDAPRSILSFDEASLELEKLLEESIRGRMIADVPLGAFLSGGIDSSTVVALMQKNSLTPIKTFTIGFDAPDYNEAPFAQQIAQHLNTDHHELYLSAADAQAAIPEMSTCYDEPFADASQIPTYLVSRLARQHVTVSLSGDGGDELFAGYTRYRQADTIRRLFYMPAFLRQSLSGLMTAIPPARWDRLATLLPATRRMPLMGDKIHKLAHVIDQDDPYAGYEALTTFWPSPAALINEASHIPEHSLITGKKNLPYRAWMQRTDLKTYLPDDILVKLDRASMAVGLEAREPLLDHRVVEFALSLPPTYSFERGVSKRILRHVLEKYVPADVFNRPKQGFALPIGEWMRGSLRPWTEDLLAPSALKQVGLDPAPIRARLAEHMAGTRNWQYALWGVLMYVEWQRRWKVGMP